MQTLTFLVITLTYSGMHAQVQVQQLRLPLDHGFSGKRGVQGVLLKAQLACWPSLRMAIIGNVSRPFCSTVERAQQRFLRAWGK